MGHDMTAAQEREQAFADALRADGLRMTHQRLEVIRELASATHHPDADELFTAVRERVPTISRDTVYRTLTTLAAKGLIERLGAPGAARFDPDVSMHHHFVCTRCGRILDLQADDLGEPEVPSGLPGISEIVSVRLEIRGVCEQCAADGGRVGDAGH